MYLYLNINVFIATFIIDNNLSEKPRNINLNFSNEAFSVFLVCFNNNVHSSRHGLHKFGQNDQF